MQTITTRTAAVAFLIAAGKPEAMAKVAVNELFNQIPVKEEDDKDEIRVVTGENSSALAQVEEGELEKLYTQVIANGFDVEGDEILIYGMPKYNINGDILPLVVNPQMKEFLVEHKFIEEDPAQNAPSSDTVQ